MAAPHGHCGAKIYASRRSRAHHFNRCLSSDCTKGYALNTKGYALKENLRRCWNHRLERTARKHFLAWIRWAKRSALKPFGKVAAMIAKRLTDIVNSFHHPITNGPQEGMNAKLMSVIRAGRAYRHHDTFRMAALFFLGKLDMFPRHEVI